LNTLKLLARLGCAALVCLVAAGGETIVSADDLAAPTPAATPTARAAGSPMPQPSRVPSATPTAGPPTASPTPPAPPSPSATATSSATATPLPATPTARRLTPAPTGYFLSSYRGQTLAPGLESGVIRGQVLDYRGFGIANVPVSLAGNNLSVQTACGADGSFAFGGLKPALYSLSVGGFPGEPAQGLFVGIGQIVNVDFVEAERPGSVSPSAVPANASPTGETATKGQSAVVIVVLTPEGVPIARPSATPRSSVASTAGGLIPRWDNPMQALVTGAVGAGILAALGLLTIGFRR
jgi:hypothetical protein